MAKSQPRLEQLLGGYMNAAATKNDVMAVVAQYRSLDFKQQKFVFNDGSTRDLVNLTGTIPIVYKNNTYNIPVCIWLMDTHPNNAPICYVQPTAEMGIRVSMHVDCNGKIYLPYLHDWTPSASELLILIQIMIVTFSDSPPVFKTDRNAANKIAYAPSAYMPQQQHQQHQHQPAMPAQYNMPYPPAGGGAGATPATYMPYPGMPSGGWGQAGGHGGPTAFPQPQAGGSALPYPSGAAIGMPGNGYNAGTGTITEEHIKVSLISAVEDKLRRRVQERVNQAQAEIETLQRVKQELQEGAAKIDERLARMEREAAEMRSNIAVLQERKAAVEKAAAEVAEKTAGDEFNVDEAVTTTAPLYRQLVTAYAEEAATEDANYYLGEALRNGVIDLEVFLKHVRQLSRKQFMLRALMQKCRQTAGLAC